MRCRDMIPDRAAEVMTDGFRERGGDLSAEEVRWINRRADKAVTKGYLEKQVRRGILVDIQQALIRKGKKR